MKYPPSGVKAVSTSKVNGQMPVCPTRRAGRFTQALGGSLLLLLSATTGCQMDIAGQTLPSGYYLTDDVQYYAPGPEFKLAREAAALEEKKAAQISQPQR